MVHDFAESCRAFCCLVRKEHIMENRNLIELYGRRFTPFVKIAAVVAVVIIGILIVYSQGV